ncbi:hypothetical protein AMEX_G25496 [Astyanax mexicanus]|uniref:Uncharacterized protein n=1 Tax=Astyanax mexicanus TaxID=7994 RepID=A0A8T2KVI3_ASTMX|nr:hypothetical protein AMEX_G25496 [Astyanax mexicanus]
MFSTQLIVTLLTTSFIAQITFTYDLQDTIKKLRDENAYLQHRLENITQALRELRNLILDHSKDGGFSGTSVDHKSEQLHAWNEWIRNGISAETHVMLQQAFCWSDLHSSADLWLPIHLCLILLSCNFLFNFLLI